MKIIIPFLAIVLICGWKENKTVAPGIAETVKTYTIEQMMDNEAVSGGSFTSDKSKLLISSNRSGIYSMYTVPTAGSEMGKVLTFLDLHLKQGKNTIIKDGTQTNTKV